MSQSGQSYSKYWVFTVNNPTEDRVPTTWPGVQWVVWQKESGEEGTPHLQGYVIWESQKRLTALKKIHSGAHWEARKGTHDQAKAYCRKAASRVDGPWEHGDEPVFAQGQRNDMLTLKRKIDAGASLKDLASDEETFACVAKYHKWVPIYMALCGKQRDWHTELLVLWGPPGTGKSREAYALDKGAYWLHRPAGQTCYWDGYHGQETVVIDEFFGWLPHGMMCRLCDRYPMQVEFKGGATPFLAKKIIITSNVHPMEWWPKVGLGAMLRRMTHPLGFIKYVGPDAPDQLQCEEVLSVSQDIPVRTPEGDGYIDVIPSPGVRTVTQQMWDCILDSEPQYSL